MHAEECIVIHGISWWLSPKPRRTRRHVAVLYAPGECAHVRGRQSSRWDCHLTQDGIFWRDEDDTPRPTCPLRVLATRVIKGWWTTRDEGRGGGDSGTAQAHEWGVGWLAHTYTNGQDDGRREGGTERGRERDITP